MTSRRLAKGGTWIDRSKPLTFRFDGVDHGGFEGDTLASALLANGVTGCFRSPNLGRPRGVMTAGPEEPNAFVEVADPGAQGGRRKVPVKVGIGNGTRTEVLDGVKAGDKVVLPG